MGLHAGDIIQKIGRNERQTNSIVTVDDLWRVLDYYRAGDEVVIKLCVKGTSTSSPQRCGQDLRMVIH